MNSRLLLVFAYAFILSFIVQYFFFPKETHTPLTSQGIILQTDKENIIIPNIPKIDVKNTGTGTFSFNTCSDLQIHVDSVPMSNIATEAPTFCEDITLGTGETRFLKMKELYKYFSHFSGKYTLTLVTPYGTRMVSVDVEKPGAIRSALSGVFYEPIYNLFVALLTVLPGHPLGWAIVIITLIIRLILLAPQHHMLMSQKKLQVIQPKIKALQEQYKDDQAKLGMEMLELYKKE